MTDPTGPDGLLEPPEPFRTPRWFTVLIAISAVAALAMAAVVLT